MICMCDKAMGVGRMSGNAKTLPQCEVMIPNHTTFQVRSSGSRRNWSVFLERPSHCTPQEGSGVWSIQPVGYTPWSSTETLLLRSSSYIHTADIRCTTVIQTAVGGLNSMYTCQICLAVGACRIFAKSEGSIKAHHAASFGSQWHDIAHCSYKSLSQHSEANSQH